MFRLSPAGADGSGVQAQVGFVHCNCVSAPQVVEQEMFAACCKRLPTPGLKHLLINGEFMQKDVVSTWHTWDNELLHALLQLLVE
jgi:hypothetical protein